MVEYLLNAPWWHFVCYIIMVYYVSRFKPVHIEKHEHKHIHTDKLP